MASSSSEDDLEEQLRMGFGGRNRRDKKRRRVQGKEFGMLGDFALDDAGRDDDLRYQPVMFASANTDTTSTDLGQDTEANSETTDKSKLKFKLGMMSFAKPGEMASSTTASENTDRPRMGMGAMNSMMNNFAGFGTPQFNSEDDKPTFQNTWSSFSIPNTKSPPSAKATQQTSKPSNNKKATKDSATYGIGAALMAKMGYVSGTGLGSDGKGILNPIEHKMRPQGLGLGGIKERTAQAKAEAKRQGHAVSDSESDSEADKKKRKGKGVVGTAQAKVRAQRKAKDIYKTIHDMEAENLHVPAGLKNIVLMTQEGQGSSVTLDSLHQSRSGTPVNGNVPGDGEERQPDAQLAFDKAFEDLNRFAKEWKIYKSRKEYVDFETEQINGKLDLVLSEISKLEGILAAFDGIDENTDLEKVVDVLENVQYQYVKEIGPFHLDELAVAAFASPFKRALAEWNPLAEPTKFKDEFTRLRLILDITHSQKNDEDTDITEHHQHYYTNYEILIYHTWLPAIIKTFREDWKYTHAASAVLLIETWTGLIPKPFIDKVLNVVVESGLKPQIKHWKPAVMQTSKTAKPLPPPHKWLFPWLPYLSRVALRDIIDGLKARFGHLVRGWRISDGAPLEGIIEWREIIEDAEMEKLLVTNLLPRLSQLLRREVSFGLDEKTDSLSEIMKWSAGFKASTFGVLLEQAVFPRWEAAAFRILTVQSDVGLMKVVEWYEHWYAAIPTELRELPTVNRELHNCLKMIEDAVNIPAADRARSLPKPLLLLEDLPSGAATPQSFVASIPGTPRPARSESTPSTPTTPVSTPTASNTGRGSASTFREVVDDHVAALDHFLLPLHRSHPILGFPLYKISRHARGLDKASVTCYFEDNVLWVKATGANEYVPVSVNDLEDVLNGN
jgi:tuftelin-interacting protein 11